MCPQAEEQGQIVGLHADMPSGILYALRYIACESIFVCLLSVNIDVC